MKEFVCKKCNKSFDSVESLRQHEESKHKYERKSNKNLKLILIFVLATGLLVYGFLNLYKTSYSNIGSVGSTHIHADFAIYINGEQITPLPEKYFVRSPYVHVEHGIGAGYVIHVHATNVNIGYFFKTIDWDFDKHCLKLDDGRKFCNDGNKTLKFYVNGEKNEEYEKYIIKNLDRILISYGDESEEEIKKQIDSVTYYSKYA